MLVQLGLAFVNVPIFETNTVLELMNTEEVKDKNSVANEKGENRSNF
jgi:hypothetical protein